MAISFRSLLSHTGFAPRRRRVIEGTTKTLFDSADPSTYVLQFKDLIAPSFRDVFPISGKGAINNRLSELFMSRLNEMGIETHFVKRLNMSEQMIKVAETIPFRVTVHNAAVDHLADRLGLDEHHIFPRPIVEFSGRSRDLNYPIISSQHIEALEWATIDELEDMMTISQRVNDFLCGQFFALGMRLLNFKLEFGRLYQSELYEDSRLIIIDEISPDTCAVLDLKTGERLDGLCQANMDRTDLVVLYQEVARRFGILEEGGPIDLRETLVIHALMQEDSTFGVMEKTEIDIEKNDNTNHD